MTTSRRGPTLARWLLLAVCLTPPGAFADDVAAQGDARGELDVPSDLQWSDVGPDERLPVLELLDGQTRANYEKIHTWKGSCSVRLKQSLTENYVSRVFGNSLPKGQATALRQEFQFHLKFAIDTGASAVFRDQETSRMDLFRPGSNQPIPVKDRENVDYRTIVTPEHYIRFSPKSIFPGFVVADIPEARNKRAARREPPENALPHETGDTQDPRNFFGFDYRTKFWDSLHLEARSFGGLLGVMSKSLGNDRLKISKATGHESTWYRHNGRYGDEDKVMVSKTTIYCSAAGFNPVSMTQIERGKTVATKQWRWKKVDGVFLPAVVREVFYKGADGGMSYERVSSLGECTLNQALDPHQFDYQSLGMKEGDIILDEIDRVVFAMKGGKPVKLANYNDPHAAGTEGRRISRNQLLLIAANTLFFATLLIFFCRNLRRKREVGPSPKIGL